MNKQDQARRTAVEIKFAGVDITKDIRPYLLSVTYTDNEEDEADDLQIRIHDRDNVWLTSWLEEVIQAAAAAKLKISATIKPENWGNDAALPTGDFELDSVAPSGPPAEVSIKGTALPFSAPIRQTRKSKAWESYNLSGIANEIAGNAGMTCMYEASNDPFYRRVEQVKTSDIDFLSRLIFILNIKSIYRRLIQHAAALLWFLAQNRKSVPFYVKLIGKEAVLQGDDRSFLHHPPLCPDDCNSIIILIQGVNKSSVCFYQIPLIHLLGLDIGCRVILCCLF